MLCHRVRFLGLALVLSFAATSSRAGALVYDINLNGGLAGFNAAAGSPGIVIDFDGMAPGTDLTGVTEAGILFSTSSAGAPLLVVPGADTFTAGGYGGIIDPTTNQLLPTTGRNVLSPGGIELGPGPNPSIENDDLILEFTLPVDAFGFDHLSQSADGGPYTYIEVYNQFGDLLYSEFIGISNVGGLGGGAPAAADFWGIVTDGSDLIARIVIDEFDDDDTYPDNNIGFDTFRMRLSAVPEPSTLAMLVLPSALLGGMILRSRIRQRA